MATAYGLKRSERAFVLLMLLLRLILCLQFQALLELSNSRSVDGAARQGATLQSAAIEARLVAVEALTNNFATTDDDGAMAVVERRKVGLGQAEVKIHIAWRHFIVIYG